MGESNQLQILINHVRDTGEPLTNHVEVLLALVCDMEGVRLHGGKGEQLTIAPAGHWDSAAQQAQSGGEG